MRKYARPTFTFFPKEKRMPQKWLKHGLFQPSFILFLMAEPLSRHVWDICIMLGNHLLWKYSNHRAMRFEQHGVGLFPNCFPQWRNHHAVLWIMAENLIHLLLFFKEIIHPWKQYLCSLVIRHFFKIVQSIAFLRGSRHKMKSRIFYEHVKTLHGQCTCNLLAPWNLRKKSMFLCTSGREISALPHPATSCMASCIRRPTCKSSVTASISLPI